MDFETAIVNQRTRSDSEEELTRPRYGTKAWYKDNHPSTSPEYPATPYLRESKRVSVERSRGLEGKAYDSNIDNKCTQTATDAYHELGSSPPGTNSLQCKEDGEEVIPVLYECPPLIRPVNPESDCRENV